MGKSSLRDKTPLLSMQGIIIAVALLLVFFAAGARFGVYLQRDAVLAYDMGGEVSLITVDIKGAVSQPGLYQFPQNSRVEDALAVIALAADAETALLNQAAYLVDGTELIVPVKDGEINWNSLAATRGGVYYGNSSSVSDSSSVSASIGVININTAASEQLQLLNGIGPSKAQNIIDYRDNYGPFLTIEQIMNVSGIGSATFEKIKEHICVE